MHADASPRSPHPHAGPGAIELGADDVEPLSDAEWRALAGGPAAAPRRLWGRAAAAFAGGLGVTLLCTVGALQLLARHLLPAEVSSPGAASVVASRQPVPQAIAPTVTYAGQLDRLAYPDLQQQVAALQRSSGGTAAQAGLLRWGQYRLSTAFDDRPAANQLAAWQARLPADLGELPPLQAAAAAGARGRLAPDPLHSPQAALVSAQALASRDVRRAQQLSLWALRQAPQMADAKLLHHRLQLQRSPSQRAVAGLQALCLAQPDGMAARVAPLLEQVEAYGALESCLQALGPSKAWVNAAPGQRDALYDWAIKHQLQQGATGAAAALGTERLRGHYVPPRAFADLARLQSFRGEQPQAQRTLQQGLRRAGLPAARAEIIYYAVKQAQQQGDAAAVERHLAATTGLRSRETAGWLPLTLGAYAQQRGRLREARYHWRQAQRAGRPEAAFALHQLEAEGAAGDAPPAVTPGLRQLARRHDARALLQLGRLEVARGRPAHGAHAFVAALYADPLADDPRKTFTAWLHSLAAAGHAEVAMQRADRSLQLGAAEPLALQAWLQVVRPHSTPHELAEKLAQVQRQHPDSPAVTVALSHAYVAADRPHQAIAVGEPLVRQQSGAYHPELLYILGRAYRQRDPQRARHYLRRASVAQPRAPVYYELARLETGEGRRQAARQALQQALRLDPQHADSHALLGSLLIQSGDAEAGRHHLRAAAAAASRAAAAPAYLWD